MNITPTIILQLGDYDGLMLQGDDVAKLISVLKGARSVCRQGRWSDEWRECQPDYDFKLPIQVFPDSPMKLTHQRNLALEIEVSRQILAKHKDLIDAAEQLTPPPDEPSDCDFACSKSP